ncbi:alpha/beta hydrolase [Thermodesulfobacteriota bacterium]
MKLEFIVHRPDSEQRQNPILFVHGMWHGAWCWAEHFLPHFAGKGYKSCALSFRGHGESEGSEKLRWASVADYVADLDRVVGEMDRPPILVGHSMGGMVVQKYLETNSAPAAILLAPAPPQGLLVTSLRFLWHHPLPFLKANLALRMYPIVSTPDLARYAFFSSDFPEEELESYFDRLQDDSYRAYLDMICLNLPKPTRIETDILILGAADDTIFSPAQIEAAGRSYGTQAEIFPNMAHDMMLESGWQAVADRMSEWLAGKGL